jgi:hypothetical protein
VTSAIARTTFGPAGTGAGASHPAPMMRAAAAEVDDGDEDGDGDDTALSLPCGRHATSRFPSATRRVNSGSVSPISALSRPQSVDTAGSVHIDIQGLQSVGCCVSGRGHCATQTISGRLKTEIQ